MYRLKSRASWSPRSALVNIRSCPTLWSISSWTFLSTSGFSKRNTNDHMIVVATVSVPAAKRSIRDATSCFCERYNIGTWFWAISSAVASPVSGQSLDSTSNAQSAEHEVCCMAQWAPCHCLIQHGLRRGNEARQCNFERFPSLTLHRYIISRNEKVTKFGKDNYGMHRIGRKGEGRVRSSLIRGGRKTPTVAAWRLVNDISHTWPQTQSP